MSLTTLPHVTMLTKNFSGRDGHKIEKITIHHTAGIATAEGLGNEFITTEYQKSSNYGIGIDGKIGLYVDEAYRAWTSNSYDNDVRAITIEVSNDVNGEPWSVSDASYNSLINLCVDICKRNDIKELLFTGDASGNLTAHRYFASTLCPGDWLYSRFPMIANEVNKRIIIDNKVEDDKSAILNRISALEKNNLPIYGTISEVPDWAKSTIMKLSANGILQGTGEDYHLSYEMIRLLVILDRSGVFG